MSTLPLYFVAAFLMAAAGLGPVSLVVLAAITIHAGYREGWLGGALAVAAYCGVCIAALAAGRIELLAFVSLVALAGFTAWLSWPAAPARSERAN